MTLEGAPVELVAGAGQVLVDLARVLLAAEATGIARECTVQASDYAKVRQQFGAPHRHLPGGEAPLRQHGRVRRTGHRCRMGRGPSGGRRR